MHVHPVPAFADNYLWVLHNDRYAAVVDPGDARPVIDFLAAKDLALVAVLCTHHHADHVGGVDDLLDFLHAHGTIPVYGPAGEDIPARSGALREGARVALPALELEFDVLDVPGHTAGHIAYVGHDMLFCGDTLFGCGCGRMFEGTPAQFAGSLAKFKALAPQTRVYCAHEYTMGNIKFAEAVEPGNRDLQLRKAFSAARRHRDEPTLPSTIGLELATNPFLRWDAPEVMASASKHAGKVLTSREDIFATLRQWKNNF